MKQERIRIQKYSNYPIAGRWNVVRRDEQEVILSALTPTQLADLHGGGWARVKYRTGNQLWNALVKLTDTDYVGPLFDSQ